MSGCQNCFYSFPLETNLALNLSASSILEMVRNL